MYFIKCKNMHSSPNLRNNIIVSNNNSVIFCSGFFCGFVLVNLERKEITKKKRLALSSNVPNKKSFISRDKEDILAH